MRRAEPQVQFEASSAPASLELLSEERRALARSRFEQATLGKSEAWWYTPLGKRLAPRYELGAPSAPKVEVRGQVMVLSFAELNALALSGSLAGSTGEGALELTSAQAALSRARELLAEIATEEGEAYCALNSAHVERGLVIYASSSEAAELPEVKVTWRVDRDAASASTDSMSASLSRSLVICEPGCELKVTERFVSPDDSELSAALSAHVTELWAGEGAQLTYLRSQATALDHQHVGRVAAYAAARAQVKSTLLNLGGALSRVEIEASLNGEGADVSLEGAFTGSGEQLLDQHLTLRHMSPRCTSSQRFKGLIGGEARGVFTGRVYVAEGAAGTRAEQNNPNLLLTEGARAMTRPQLEIYNDDVECSHGATVGQLDERAMFYLRSRGLSRARAERMLAEAFVGEVLGGLSDEELLADAQSAIQRTLKTLDELDL